MLALGATDAAELLIPSRCPELEEQSAILEGFRSMFADGLVPEEVAPAKWSRFAENVYCLFEDRRWSRPGGPPSVGASKLLEACRAKAGTYNPLSFPRLMSLHQFVLGCAIESGLLTLPIQHYTPLLTDELRQVFPNLVGIAAGFDLES